MFIESRYCCHHYRCSSHHYITENFTKDSYLNALSLPLWAEIPWDSNPLILILNIFILCYHIFNVITYKMNNLCDNFLYLHIAKLRSHLELTLSFSIQSILNVFKFSCSEAPYCCSRHLYIIHKNTHKNYIGSIFTNQQGFK